MKESVPVSPLRLSLVLLGRCEKVSQMEGVRLADVGEPSVWYAAVTVMSKMVWYVG